jgi:hypothetical protein
VAEGRLSADDRYSVAALALYVTFTHACFALFSLEKCFFLIPSLGFTGLTSLMPLARGYGSYWQGRGEIKAFQALIQRAAQALVWCQNSCISGMLAVMGVGRKSSFKGRRVPDESSIARGWYGPTSPHASRPDITWPHSGPSAHPRARLYNSEESSKSRHLHQHAELLGSLATRSWLHEVGRAVDASFLLTYGLFDPIRGDLPRLSTKLQDTGQTCGSCEQRRQRTPALLANSTFGVLYSLRPFTTVLPEPWYRFHIA